MSDATIKPSQGRTEDYAEARDAHRKYVLIGAASLIVILVFGALIIWSIYGKDLRAQMNVEPKYSETEFPEPRLQKNPTERLLELRAQEKLELSTYAWSDSEHHTAHVPIDRALELIAKNKMISSVEPKGGHDAK